MGELPTTTDHSPKLIAALVSASKGDFRQFDEADKVLFLRRTPEETSTYFQNRFNMLAG